MLALTHLLTLVASCTGPRKDKILTNIERKPRSFCSVSVKRSCGTLSTDMHAEMSSSPHAAMTKTRNRETLQCFLFQGFDAVQRTAVEAFACFLVSCLYNVKLCA